LRFSATMDIYCCYTYIRLIFAYLVIFSFSCFISFFIDLSSHNSFSSMLFSLRHSLLIVAESSIIVPNLLGWGDGGRRCIILNLNILFF